MAGDRVRITTQLIEVSTDSHLWSESYDRDLSDIFAVQDEIAAKVGEALKVALLGADSKPIRTSSETSIDVYSDYLLARQKMASATVAALGEAERLLKAVIERDPNYAPAYAALSSTYRSMALFQSIPLSEAFARMTPLVEQALHLDGDLGEAWQNLAYVRRANRDLEGARAARERALKLNPQDLYVLEGQITYWIYTHEPERGLGFAEEMLRVDPLSPSSLQWAGTLYRQIGRLDDAKEMLERTRSINPPNAVYFYNASIYALYDGDLATAITSMERYLTLDPVDSEVTATVALVYFELGDVAGAEFWKESALRRDPGSSGARLTAAFLHLYHNEEAEAVAIARELVQPGLRTWGNPKAVALRIVAASDLAAGRYQQTIARYVTHYPELADGEFPIGTAALKFGPTGEIFSATLGLAATYLRAGENEKADSLLSLVESELPHWPADMAWGHGFADVELHALRGEKERALVALRGHTARRTTQWWRWYLLHDPNLESLHDEPEYQAMVAEIEADMAEQLARVREMERNGELEPIPEVSATIQ
jgi:tetratricopeptide (TPR) repeat protein